MSEVVKSLRVLVCFSHGNSVLWPEEAERYFEI